MIGHGVKALWLTPERLHDRMDLRRKLSDSPTRRSSVCAVGGPKILTNHRGAAGTPPIKSAAQARTTPKRARTTPILDNNIAPRNIRARCGVGTSHSVGGSIKTMPTTYAGWRAACMRTTKLPNEWPTGTRRSPAAIVHRALHRARRRFKSMSSDTTRYRSRQGTHDRPRTRA